MATVILNNDKDVERANSAEKLRVRQSTTINNLLVAYPDALPDDFKFVFHDDLRYIRKGGEASDKCYCGLVPFFGGQEHLELALLQWDLLVENIPTFDSKGEFVKFDAPTDLLHKFARDTASADKEVRAWLNAIIDKFKDVSKYKFVKSEFMSKTTTGRVFPNIILGIVEKQFSSKRDFHLDFPLSLLLILLLTL